MRIATEVTDAEIAEMVTELDVDAGGDGVWIDPAFVKKYDITPAQEASLEQAVGDAKNDVVVLLVDVPVGDERFNNAPSVVAWVEDDIESGATYVVTRHTYEGHQIDTVAHDDEIDDIWVGSVASDEHPDDPVAQALFAIELVDSGKAGEIHDQQVHDEYGGSGSGEGGIGDGWLIGGAVALVLVGLVMGARALRRKEKGSAPKPLANEPRFQLPERVLRTVREAEDRQVRQRADRAVLALGEALDAAEITDRSPATLDAWQAALDHYAASRRVLEEAGSPADVMGALVLAERGASALAATRVPGQRWEPTRTCFFHPLHSGPTTGVSWSGESGSAVTVPACGACAAALADGEEPTDVLDFVDGQETVHYFVLDIPPWSTTGYGSLEPDLLAALLRTAS